MRMIYIDAQVPKTPLVYINVSWQDSDIPPRDHWHYPYVVPENTPLGRTDSADLTKGGNLIENSSDINRKTHMDKWRHNLPTPSFGTTDILFTTPRLVTAALGLLSTGFTLLNRTCVPLVEQRWLRLSSCCQPLHISRDGRAFHLPS